MLTEKLLSLSFGIDVVAGAQAKIINIVNRIITLLVNLQATVPELNHMLAQNTNGFVLNETGQKVNG